MRGERGLMRGGGGWMREWRGVDERERGRGLMREGGG